MVTQNTTKFDIKRKKAIKLWKITNGHITNICKELEIERKTFYNWLKNPDFVNSINDSEAELNDKVRDLLIQKCMNGNITAIIFFLRSKHPDFREDKKQKLDGVSINFQDWSKNNIPRELINKYDID